MHETLGYRQRKCGYCNKEFECKFEYAYKRFKSYGKGFTYFCSYKCLRAYDKKKEEEEYKRKFTI